MTKPDPGSYHVKAFEGRVAVVTGAASGIGLALAQELLARGANVVAADLDVAALQAAAAGLASRHGGHVLAVPTDVSSPEQVEALARRTVARFGKVNIICNNAGVTAYGYNCWEAPPQTWEWLYGVNVGGVLNGIRAFVPRILEAGEGHVVNTSSMVALRGRPQRGPYAATKCAILGISQCLRIELAALNPDIGVTVLVPASTATNFRDSGRHWPARLGPVAAVADRPGAMPGNDEPGRVPASAVAGCAIEAIEKRRFLATPHLPTARAALHALTDDLYG